MLFTKVEKVTAIPGNVRNAWLMTSQLDIDETILWQARGIRLEFKSKLKKTWATTTVDTAYHNVIISHRYQNRSVLLYTLTVAIVTVSMMKGVQLGLRLSDLLGINY